MKEKHTLWEVSKEIVVKTIISFYCLDIATFIKCPQNGRLLVGPDEQQMTPSY